MNKYPGRPLRTLSRRERYCESMLKQQIRLKQQAEELFEGQPQLKNSYIKKIVKVWTTSRCG